MVRVDQDDLERRVAELERRLAEAQAFPAPDAIHERARQFAEALWEGVRTPPPSGSDVAQRNEKWARLRTESISAAINAGLSQAQYNDVLKRAGLPLEEGGRAFAALGEFDLQTPIDLAAMGRQALASGRQEILARGLGLAGQSGFRNLADTRLAAAPRRIPLTFWLAELLPYRWWVHLWILGMVGVTPLALWSVAPKVFAMVAVLVLLAIYGFNAVGTAKRFALLRWGQVATVTATRILSQGTYYSGTTWSNVPLPVAHGWRVERPMYSGPGTKTQIRYTINGHPGELVVSGREYHDGVVLADPRQPARALCVTSFPYDLDRDDAGNWVGSIRLALAIQMVVWLAVVIGWLTLAGLAALA